MRRILGRASRRFRRQFRGVRVAIVVAVSDEETTRIGPLLDTLRAQTHRNLDIHVVPWGRSGVVRSVARAHAAQDWRISVARRTEPDAPAAWATARRARGRYVLLPAGGDLLTPTAIEVLLAALERSGSAVAIGRVAVPRQGYAVPATARSVAHLTERLGVLLSQAPEAAADLTLGSRLWRRDALPEMPELPALPGPPGSVTPSGTPEPGRVDLAAAGLRHSFDLVPQITYLRADRRDDVVFGARPRRLEQLEDWWATERHLLDLVTAIEGPAGARTGNPAVRWRCWALLDTWLQVLLDDAERATPEQWQRLRAIADEIPRHNLPVDLGAEAKLKLWLLGQDRRDELADLVFARTFEGGDQPTRVQDAPDGPRILAELPAPAGVPADRLEMSEAETPLLLDLRAVAGEPGTGAERVVLDLVGWIDHLGLPEAPALVVDVTAPDGTGVPAELAQRHDPTANHGLDRRPCHDVAHGAFTVSFPAPAADQAPGRHRVRLTLTTQGVTRTGEVLVDVNAPHAAPRPQRGPLAVDERGPYYQRELQRWAASADLPIEPDLFYLQSYTGQHATDSQRALYDELRRRFPRLRLVWGIATPDVALPAGAEGVVIGSRAWYRTMVTAHYLSLNIDPDRWFARRDGQLLLQTFHGYPSKAMGLSMWHAKQYGERRIAFELGRVQRDWSLILTPTEEMAGHYREQYSYDGPILSVGYPRDDLLRSPQAPQIRQAVRAGLGIAPHQKAVLYAPTWRDDLATDWRSAEAVLHLDVERAARALGPDYVLLLRGHRFHQLRPIRGKGARLEDVTAYPEVNELILAADAAVVDYSSIRFDLAFAGVPQVFLVPDLDTYGSSKRGFLYPFTDTTPGPLVATTDEAVGELADLDGLRDRTAPAVAAFNRRFHPWHDDGAARRVVDELESRWGLGRA
jgi:CDP-glycerol glycerophosphotransferase (TagB/SpsB family)